MTFAYTFPFWLPGEPDGIFGFQVINGCPQDEVGDDGLRPSQRGRADVAKVADHAALIPCRILSQFKQSPKLIGLIQELVRPLNDVETAAFELMTERWIDTAFGRQLDIIGRILGEPRITPDDELYRVRLKVRLRVLRSHGRRRDLLRIARLLIPDDSIDIRFREYSPCVVEVTVPEPMGALVRPLELYRILQRAKGGGVRLQLIYTESPSTETFHTDTAELGMGLGSVYDPTIGGAWASIHG